MRTPTLAVVTLGLLLAAGCADPATSSSNGAPATSTSTTMVAPANSAANEALLAAASPFEDLTEFAEAGDLAGMDRSIASFKQHIDGVRADLSPATQARLDSLASSIEDARARDDRPAAALASVEAYRTLIEALDPAGLAVPREVSLLDYAGFRLRVQATAPQPDWAAMQATLDEASGWWTAVEPRVDQTGLKDAVNSALAGAAEAVSARDVPMTTFAAQMDLDLVDLLEHYFETAPATA